ncbi:MAG: AGE family epimerase/isomerase [Phaeodactylibacter sp.]|nr:AGE family epimerase/isomerase [Phaeodactylibacter sp.]
MSNSIKKPPPQNIDLTKLKSEFRQELFSIIDWWSSHMVDEKNGGFFGRVDGYGRLDPEADKGVILNARLLWAYSAAAPATGNALHYQLAQRAYTYLCEHFWDDLEGGVFWSVDHQGNPADTQKQVYAQAFAIYAFSAYYALTQKREALEQAEEIFWLIEKYSFDRQQNGYLSAFARDWSPMDDIRLSEKDANEAKIMNTHLHILEAYTNLFRVNPFAALREPLENIIGLFLDRFYIPDSGSMHIYFDENWAPKGQDISFGHNVEASWLLWEAAEVLGNAKIQERVRPICLHMAEAVLLSAVDSDGAILYEACPMGLKDTNKHWWPQAEAVVGFWNAWQLTGEEQYAEAAVNCWSFIKRYLLDPEEGEWHWRTDRCGKPVLSEDKAGPWKAPYHNSRMCLEMERRLPSR